MNYLNKDKEKVFIEQTCQTVLWLPECCPIHPHCNGSLYLLQMVHSFHLYHKAELMDCEEELTVHHKTYITACLDG